MVLDLSVSAVVAKGLTAHTLSAGDGAVKSCPTSTTQ